LLYAITFFNVKALSNMMGARRTTKKRLAKLSCIPTIIPIWLVSTNTPPDTIPTSTVKAVSWKYLNLKELIQALSKEQITSIATTNKAIPHTLA